MKKISTAVPANIKNAMTDKGIITPRISYPYVGYLFYDDKAGDLGYNGEDNREPPPVHRQEFLYVAGHEKIKEEPHCHGRGRKYVARKPRLSAIDLYLPPYHYPLPYGAREPLENLAEIPADLAVDVRRHDEEPHIRRIHPQGKMLQGFARREPERLLLVGGPEKPPGRLRHLRAHKLDGRAERVSGLQGPRYHVERIREELGELGYPRPLLPQEEIWRNKRPDGRKQKRPQRPASYQYTNRKPEDREKYRNYQVNLHVHLEPGAVYEPVNLFSETETVEKLVYQPHLPEYLDPQVGRQPPLFHVGSEFPEALLDLVVRTRLNRRVGEIYRHEPEG